MNELTREQEIIWLAGLLPFMGSRRKERIEDILKKWKEMQLAKRDDKTLQLFAVA